MSYCGSRIFKNKKLNNNMKVGEKSDIYNNYFKFIITIFSYQLLIKNKLKV